MSKLLVFLNEVEREDELFYSISNFLSKFSHKAAIKKKDVVHIKSKVIDVVHYKNAGEIVQQIKDHINEFKDINRPENIYVSLERFEIAFCVLVRMDILRDVSELCSLLLIKQYYESFRIFFLFQGDQGDYHKVSHFFSTINREEYYYNSIYYQCLPGKSVQRLQMKSIGALKHFLPIQKVNRDLLEFFTADITKYISKEWMEALLNNKEEWRQIKGNEILYGSSTLVYQNRNCFDRDSLWGIIGEITSLNVLSWLFFAYAIGEFKKEKEIIRIEQIKAFLRQMKSYANGCLQLLENIVFHSPLGKGVFSFRICNGESDYILRKYNEGDSRTSFLEIMIADYSDGIGQYNLAQNFAVHIENQSLRQQFADLTPADFFTGGLTDEALEVSRKRWASYYEIEDNIGKHFGIRIFENIVHQSNGKFILESHAEHGSQKGESQKKTEGDKCLPGTEYTILLPIRELQKKLLYTDIAIDKDIDIEGETVQYLDCHVINEEINDINCIYRTQEEKKTIINGLANRIIETYKRESPQIWFIKVSDLEGSCGELLCKAILLSKINILNMPHWVFYDCENDFIDTCIQMITAIFRNNRHVYALTGNGFQIALFSKDTYDEIILVPDDYRQTIWLNEHKNFSKDNIFGYGNMDIAESKKDSTNMAKIIPFDVLHPVKIKNETKTFFEFYTKRIIERDIQEKAYGCKISDTHMRLGSTVHVNLFYEAELLFGNKLFISRFAYLIVKDLFGKLGGVKKLTLYGYATYSELLIFEVMNIIKRAFRIDNIDYAILEREMENRGDSHVDKIRYSHYEPSEAKRKTYFEDRSFVYIVPIASTLKTNEKMISMFCSHNGEACADHIIEHYALVLVGPDCNNNYWEIKEDNRINSRKEEWKGVKPKYFIRVHAAYEEAMECEMCFPKNTLDEKPLIEVNAASTIPNQSFGLYGDKDQKMYIPEWEEIRKEQSSLKCLKDSLIYSHVKRGENHFLYYFQTEKLSVQYNEEIERWLKSIRDKIKLNADEYHVIFCPSHFSNAGYLELINRIIFQNAALIIRDDVDKEYRSNIMAKYSNLYLLFEQLQKNQQNEKTIKFYYVDDSIITGRTFWRSKSLVEAVAGLYADSYKNRIHIFEKIFVLVDRNSSYSKMQYLRRHDGDRTGDIVQENFFAFRSVRISSLRNHGDSCVICKLKREAERLYAESSTLRMSMHWKKERAKFKVKSLKQYLLENKDLSSEKKERAYRRLVCTHTIHKYINEGTHGNYQEKAAEGILKLLLIDYKNRSKERFEYFLSYLKVMSRPFIVFNKSLKQAVFDILLLLTEWQMAGQSMQSILENIGIEKEYLNKGAIKQSILDLEEQILNNITDFKDKKDLSLVLLKQLTELKSNYIIRIDNMNKIANYAQKLPKEEKDFFYDKYLQLVKLLIGVNSDTSKSAWLDHTLHYETEYNNDKRIPILLPDCVKERMYLENTRVLLDGIKKLCKLCFLDEGIEEIICNLGHKNGETILSGKIKEVQDMLTDYQFGNFKQILRNYQYIDFVEGEEKQNSKTITFSKEGEIWVFSGMLLFQLLSEKTNEENEEKYSIGQGDDEKKERDGTAKRRLQEEILKKCHLIVVLLKNILCAESVKIVMETDAEYNEWIGEVYDHYNELVSRFQKMHPDEEVENLEVSLQKEYVLLADSKSVGSDMQDLELGITARLQAYRKDELAEKYGYVINDEVHYFIWEMDGGQEHPILIYAELNPKIVGEQRRNNVRNGMMFNYLLNDKIFSNNNGSQLYELITNSRDLRMSSRSKAHSHTKNDVRMKQYEQVCGKEKYQKYYQSNILTLLADLNVSEIYRKSLKKDYYLDSCDIRPIKWNDEISILKHSIEIFYIADKVLEPVPIKVCVEKKFSGDEKIGDEDELMCYNVANAGREVYLLLYSLILNAGVAGRSQMKENSVTVYLSKTQNGNLRIANLLGRSKRDIVEINKDLKYPPANEDKGISLWSMSRYIKGIIYSILQEEIYEKLNSRMEKCQKEDIEKYKNSIQQLLDDEFEVKASWESYENELYFSLEVPILAGKYQKYLKLF